MFKKITALVVLMAFVGQTFSAPFILLDYYTNTAAYAKNCVNKALPKMRCNGKCQVMKKMREEERREQENSQRQEAIKFQVLSAKSFYPQLIYPDATDLEAVKNYTPYLFVISSFPADFFHPPQGNTTA